MAQGPEHRRHRGAAVALAHKVAAQVKYGEITLPKCNLAAGNRHIWAAIWPVTHVCESTRAEANATWRWNTLLETDVVNRHIVPDAPGG